MKRKDLIRAVEEIGCVFIRHGGRHDWYQNPETKNIATSPSKFHCQLVMRSVLNEKYD